MFAKITSVQMFDGTSEIIMWNAVPDLSFL